MKNQFKLNFHDGNIPNNNLFRLFLENAPTAVAMFDNKMRYLAYSKRWIIDTKVNGSNLIGKYHYDIVPEIPQRWKDIHQRGLNGEIIESEFDSVIRSDGNVEFNKWKVVPWKNLDGTIGGIILFLEIITDFVHIERELTENREFLEFVLEETNVGLFEFNFTTNILTLNRGWVEFLGYELDYRQLPLEDWLNLIHPEDAEIFLRKSQDYLNGFTSDLILEFRLQNKEGKYFWLLLKGKILVRDSNNRPVRMVGSIFDITEQINKQISSAETNKMEALGRLAGGIAHDFNNLLTVYQNFNNLLMKENDQAKKTSYHDKLNESIDKGKKLVSQLLSFSRNQKPTQTELNINKFILDSFSLLKMLLSQEKTIEISLDLDNSDPIFTGDAIQFEQILINIFSNACDAIKEKGTIVITTTCDIEKDFYVVANKIDPRKHLLFSIKDNGIGMNSEILKKIFEPFFTTKYVRKGTGLGTAIIYSIAKAYNWKIDIKSEVDKGTDFRIFIPKSR